MDLEAKHTVKSKTFYSCMILLMIACGKPHFRGSSTPHRNEEQKLVKPLQLSWLWECDGQPLANTPLSDEDHLVIEGEGPHQLDAERLNGAPVQFVGQICPSQDITRSILFVIDVSGSTVIGGAGGGTSGGTDVPSNGTCNRLKAVQSVINSAKQSGTPTQFAVVTFASDVVASSSKFFPDENSLFADLTKSNPSGISSILCFGGGDTRYEKALSGAKLLLDSLGKDKLVSKELFFISDGEPSGATGKAEADAIKQDGIIATVMFGDRDDSILKNEIASRDGSGRPLHERAEKSADLATVLGGFVINAIEKVSLAVRSNGQDEWQKNDVSDNISSNDFNFEAFKIDTNLFPNGVELEFSYTDKFGFDQVNKGTILWSKD